jgi:hypothetical protein
MPKQKAKKKAAKKTPFIRIRKATVKIVAEPSVAPLSSPGGA